MCGGAFVSDDLRVRLQNFLIKGHVVVAFGMTELGGLPIVSLPDVKLGTTGSLCPMVQVIVIDDDGNRLKMEKFVSNFPLNFSGIWETLKHQTTMNGIEQVTLDILIKTLISTLLDMYI